VTSLSRAWSSARRPSGILSASAFVATESAVRSSFEDREERRLWPA
jgi:hypothetical protein